MNYDEQVKEIGQYFRKHEKNSADFKLGVEFEYFVVWMEDLTTVSYYGEQGIEQTLKQLEHIGYIGIYEEEHLLGLKKDGSTITLEPGSQLEISIKPYQHINDIEANYLEILHDLVPLLEAKGQCLMATGYQPHSKINDIKQIPKKRYGIMEQYFRKCGKYAHHMMKGTASLQISIDYESEEDYRRKYQIAYALSPVFYAMFDNAPVFEGEWFLSHSVRSLIWNNCDNDRCGIIPNVMDFNFGYNHYAEFILNHSPIFVQNENIEKPFKELFDPSHYNIEDLEHVLSMSFPDVRTKKIIEFRMMDSLPYPINLSVVALFKGLFYDENNLEILSRFSKTIQLEDILNARSAIVKEGVIAEVKNHKITDLMSWLYQLAKQGLNNEEEKYLKPFETYILRKCSPKDDIQKLSDLKKAFECTKIKLQESGGILEYNK